MGTKYMIRTSEVREYPLKTVDYTDYYVGNVFQLIKLLISKRGQVVYYMVNTLK